VKRKPGRPLTKGTCKSRRQLERSVRKAYLGSDLTIRMVAERFGISPATALRIIQMPPNYTA
jgi:hypothetical protein